LLFKICCAIIYLHSGALGQHPQELYHIKGINAKTRSVKRLDLIAGT